MDMPFEPQWPEAGEILLTPGPLTTAASTRASMLRDWGSRSLEFAQVTQQICKGLERLAGAGEAHVCVPLQGSGTFAIEATLRTLLGPEHCLLVLANGVYGRRMAEICERAGRRVMVATSSELEPVDPAQVLSFKQQHPELTHVAVVHVETTSGVRNPIEAVAKVAKVAGLGLIVDAMSSFGALPIDVQELSCEALISSANKALEGVPGVAFAIVDKEKLVSRVGRVDSLVLDLAAQWTYMKRTGEWRFTPPTHVLAALAHALELLEAEGGVAARRRRYEANLEVLWRGMSALGFRPLLDRQDQSPVIATFHLPPSLGTAFDAFVGRLQERGIVLYRGALTQAPSFRMGCIGAIEPTQLAIVIREIGAVLDVLELHPAGAAAARPGE